MNRADEASSEQPPSPTISTVSGDERVKRFMASLKAPLPLKERSVEVSIIWGKKKEPMKRWLGPDDIIHTTSDGRIIGKERAFLAGYFEKTERTRCSLQLPSHCIMGEKTFENLMSADFDHINGDRNDTHVRNFRPVCPPCNRRALALQWKRIRAVASSQREREMAARPHLQDIQTTSRAESISIQSFPGAVQILFCKDGYLEKPGQHRPKKWLIGILPEKVGKGRSTTHRKYIEEEFIPQGYLVEEEFTTSAGRETHLVRTQKDASRLIERELGRNVSAFRTA